MALWGQQDQCYLLDLLVLCRLVDLEAQLDRLALLGLRDQKDQRDQKVR